MTRRYSASNVDRRAPNHSLLITGTPVFLPAKNPLPQAARIDLQRVAHALERKRSASLVVENPELSFPEFLPSVGTTRFKTMLKTSDRIDKDAGHQPHDRLDRSRTTPRGVKLCGHNGIGAKRKFIACGTRRIDSDTWIAHESPTFAAFWRGTTPTRGHVSLGEGGQKAMLRPCGRFFLAQFQVSTLHSCRREKRPHNRVCAHQHHAAAASFLIESFNLLEELGDEYFRPSMGSGSRTTSIRSAAIKAAKVVAS